MVEAPAGAPVTIHSPPLDIRHSRVPMSFETLPYRPCAGMMVLNRAGLAFIGRRVNGPEHVDSTHVWQMPQGGIDRDEDPWPAALRELHEETNISSVQRLGEVAEWLTYDIPREIVARPGTANTAARNRSGSRCALPGTRARSISRIRRAATNRNSWNGAGRNCKTCRTWSCPSSARSTSGWSRNFRNSQHRKLEPSDAHESGDAALLRQRRLQGLQLIEMARELVALSLVR